jgi:hypothetical protein
VEPGFSRSLCGRGGGGWACAGAQLCPCAPPLGLRGCYGAGGGSRWLLKPRVWRLGELGGGWEWCWLRRIGLGVLACS